MEIRDNCEHGFCVETRPLISTHIKLQGAVTVVYTLYLNPSFALTGPEYSVGP